MIGGHTPPGAHSSSTRRAGSATNPRKFLRSNSPFWTTNLATFFDYFSVLHDRTHNVVAGSHDCCFAPRRVAHFTRFSGGCTVWSSICPSTFLIIQNEIEEENFEGRCSTTNWSRTRRTGQKTSTSSRRQSAKCSNRPCRVHALGVFAHNPV